MKSEGQIKEERSKQRKLLEEQLTKLENEYKRREIELNSKLDELTQEKEELEQGTRYLQEELSELENSLQVRRNNIKNKDKELKEMKKLYEKDKHILAKNREILTFKQDENVKLLKILEDMEVQRTGLDSKSDKRKKREEKLIVEIESLSSHQKLLEAQNLELERQIESAEKELFDRNMKLDNLRKDFEMLQLEETGDIASEYEEETEEVFQLRIQIDEQKNLISQLRIEIEAATKDNSDVITNGISSDRNCATCGIF